MIKTSNVKNPFGVDKDNLFNLLKQLKIFQSNTYNEWVEVRFSNMIW